MDPPTANDDDYDDEKSIDARHLKRPAIITEPETIKFHGQSGKATTLSNHPPLDPPTNSVIFNHQSFDNSLLTIPTNNLSLRASLSQSQLTVGDSSQTTQHPRVGVGVIVVESSSKIAASPGGVGLNVKGEGMESCNICIWVGRRKGSHGSHKLALPGGHLEMNESWRDCAIREVREEMGIVLSTVNFLHVTNDVMINEKKHYITIFMIGQYHSDQNGSPRNCEPHKCEGWELYTIQQLRTMVGTNELFIPLENLLRENPCKVKSYCSLQEGNEFIEI